MSKQIESALFWGTRQFCQIAVLPQPLHSCRRSCISYPCRTSSERTTFFRCKKRKSLSQSLRSYHRCRQKNSETFPLTWTSHTKGELSWSLPSSELVSSLPVLKLGDSQLSGLLRTIWKPSRMFPCFCAHTIATSKVIRGLATESGLVRNR